MAELTFRRADPRDVPNVVALVEAAYRGDGTEGWTSESDLIGGQRTDVEMVSNLIARADTRVLLAEAEAVVVACCELRAPAGPGAAAYFGMFAVRPGQQGGGVGARVLEEAERFARDELAAASLEMTVITRRAELIAWYERRGYRRTGERRPFPYGDERYGLPKVPDLEFATLSKPLL